MSIYRIAIAATLLLMSGAGAAQTSAPEASSIARDRMAIEETLRRYVRGLDDSDLDGYLATLTPDAKFVSAEGSYSGKDAIRKYVEPVMKSRLQRKAQGDQTTTHHVVTNQSFEFIDADNVVVRAYWMFVVAHGTGKPLTIDVMGSSEDFLTRRDGKWLIKERRVAP